MAFYYSEPSHTFGEYLLVPGYSSAECIPAKVDLTTPLVKFRRGEESRLQMNIPMTSAIMQSVSNDTMAIALAKEGGISFIFGSQPIKEQAAMVARVKNYKSGFVSSDSNIKPTTTLNEILEILKVTGHSTMAVTEDGKPTGKLLGIVTSRDYRITRMTGEEQAKDFMTPFEKLVYADADSTTLPMANDLIWQHKLNMLPLVDKKQRLRYMVFRKDYTDNKTNQLELIDNKKRYVVGAGINTRDYADRVPALLKAGADVLCIDSSEGFTEWQKITLEYIHEHFPDSLVVAGNVVDAEGFRFLADAGADFIKVGIGGGSICITRETKGIGRGQATAVIDVCRARDDYFKEKGVYIPVCSDGGIVHDYHMTLALAMGADFLMLGRYFSRFDESPTDKIRINGTYYKEYWGEGSNRARNWQRYDMGGDRKLSFEEGVDSYVPYAGPLKDNITNTLAKIRSTMCNCGALNLPELREKAKITLVSATSIVEGGSHDVILRDQFSRNFT